MANQLLKDWCIENGTFGKTLLAQWTGIDVNGNSVDLDSTTSGAKKRMKWICQDCGNVWFVFVSDRTGKRSGCPKCARKRSAKALSQKNLIVGETDLASVCPDLIKEWDYEKNLPLTPQMVTRSSAKKVWWKCSECGHSWQALISNRTKDGATGCPKCAAYWRTSLPEQILYYFIKQVCPDAVNSKRFPWLKHGSEIDVYIPSLKVGIEYDGFRWHKTMLDLDLNKDKLAKDHGITLIRVREHGCPPLNDGITVIETIKPDRNGESLDSVIVALYRILNTQYGIDTNITINIEDARLDILGSFQKNKTKRSLLNDNPDLCKEWYYNKNKSADPSQVSYASNLKVWWKCSKCGHEWQATICNRNGRNSGCPVCSGRVAMAGFNDLKTKMPELAKEWNYKKNGALTPNQITCGSNKTVWWKCSICGHEWKASPNTRSYGEGCPKCGQKIKIAHNAETKRIRYSLANNYPDLAKEYDKELNITDAESISIAYTKRVWWKCPKCNNTYQSTIKTRLNGSGCPYCGEKGHSRVKKDRA